MPRTPDIPADIPADLPPRVRARLATIRRADEDRILGRVCSVCGRKNYTVAHLRDEIVVSAFGLVSVGGRWYCPECAPVRAPTPDPDCMESGEAFRVSLR